MRCRRALASSIQAKIGKGYRLISVEETPDDGFADYLQIKQKNNVYGPDISHLRLFVKERPPLLKQAIARSREEPDDSLRLLVLPGPELIWVCGEKEVKRAASFQSAADHPTRLVKWYSTTSNLKFPPNCPKTPRSTASGENTQLHGIRLYYTLCTNDMSVIN
ncbi:hypothetical protein SLEP1_g4339 [Rubroshorea leprosula]|uniref:Uncharacterized protein n=1 Tax=Rubroshorea leprosula TaxID=152421 RepID=A0AAV5HUD2_9ROSI|nr:hypothetical protein SLEP1_g4339 [Rubroshorea leprosula]